MARTDLATSLIDRATPRRWLLVFSWLALVAILAVIWPGEGDWHYFRNGSRALLGLHVTGYGRGLELYASMPSTQIGPPALLATLPFDLLPQPWDVGAARLVMTLAMLPTLWIADRLGCTLGVPDVSRRRLVLLGGFALAPAWVLVAVDFTHLDDIMVLVLTLIAMLLLAKDKPLWAAAALGAAVATKPWAIVLVPLLLWRGWRQSVLPTVVAGVVALLWWAPFLTATGTLDALWGFRLPVSSGSGLTAFGLAVGEPMPDWVRPTQVLGGAALGAFAALRGNWTGVPLVGLATRVALDPNPMFYYGVGPVIGALVWDLTRSRSGVPWTTAMTMAAFSLLPTVGSPAASSLVRVAVCVTLVLSVLVHRQRSSAPSRGAPSPATAGSPSTAT